MRRLVLPWCSAACAVVLTTGAASAALTEVPETIRPTVACMIDALGSQSRIDHVDTGVMMSNWASAGVETQRVYVEYHTVGRAKDVETIRFISIGTGSNPEFGTGLPGLFAPPDNGPDDYWTGRVTRLWQSKCGVYAWVLSN